MFKLARSRARKLGGRALRQAAGRSRSLDQGCRWLLDRYREIAPKIARLRVRLEGRYARGSGVTPENIIWIFGSGRSGSTWLRSMMEDLDGHQVWEEPMVGRLFGDFYDQTKEVDLRRPDFVMADATRKGWTRSIRNFTLDCAGYACPRLGADDYLVVKEPNGSMGAPLLMEALPESRMILLIRDPRDIVSSVLDGARRGSWLYEWGEKGGWKENALADEDPDGFVKRRARTYLHHAGAAKRAYDAHRGPKTLVRYEDLRADTLAVMRRMYGDLSVSVDANGLERAVEKHSWENIPKEKKGEGKFYRKGASGGWREDLTSE